MTDDLFVGLDLLARLLPDSPPRRPVARANKPRDEPAPSLHPHYRSFPATTSRSASRRRDGTQRLRYPPLTRSLSPTRHATSATGGRYRHRASHVPCRSRRPGSRRLHAGHHLANTRAPARPIPEILSCPRFRCRRRLFDTSTAVRLRSPSRSPPDTSPGAFSSSLTTTVVNQPSMRRFDATPRRATPKGHQSFIFHAAAHRSRSPTYIRTSPSARVAHTRSWSCRD